jgi:hypothetical protein
MEGAGALTCCRCGEESSARHESVEDCLDFLRLSVTQLNLYVARSALDAQAARRRSAALADVLQRIADLARPDADPTALPEIVRRIRKLATGQPALRGLPGADREE